MTKLEFSDIVAVSFAFAFVVCLIDAVADIVIAIWRGQSNG